MTPTQQLAEAVAVQRFGYPLDQWVADQRDAGASWRTIANKLSVQTDSIINVSWETLRNWYGASA